MGSEHCVRGREGREGAAGGKRATEEATAVLLEAHVAAAPHHGRDPRECGDVPDCLVLFGVWMQRAMGSASAACSCKAYLSEIVIMYYIMGRSGSYYVQVHGSLVSILSIKSFYVVLL